MNTDLKANITFRLYLDLVKIRHSPNSVLEGLISLDTISYDKVFTFYICGFYEPSLRLSITSINHNSALEFGMRLVGDGSNNRNNDDTYQAPNVILEENLTLAYF